MSEIDIKREEITPISLIESVNLQGMQSSIQKIKQFQALVQSQFTQNHDFGVIPGTGKPTLLKPGAEKLIMLLGLTTEFEIIESERDFDEGFFQYQVRCTLLKNGVSVTQGFGSCNTMEKKYLKQDPYTMDNTVLKMAKKRALVDAALLVGSLSDVFTQDIEDMDLQGNTYSNRQRYYTDRDGIISQAQAKRMFAIAKGDDELVRAAMERYGYKSSSSIKKTDYNKICDEIEAGVRANENNKKDEAKEEVEESVLTDKDKEQVLADLEAAFGDELMRDMD